MEERYPSRPGERLEPPNLAREKNYGVRAAKDLARAGQHAHFLQRLGFSEVQPALDPLVLERLELKTAAAEEGFEAKREIAAGTAIGVIKNPAPERGCFRRFCYFCQLRNHLTNFFRRHWQFREASRLCLRAWKS
jgi:hypothetical protein